ncbi:MAG: hypothetical protein ACUVUC_06315 [Thermoguttaceae bacterium]
MIPGIRSNWPVRLGGLLAGLFAGVTAALAAPGGPSPPAGDRSASVGKPDSPEPAVRPEGPEASPAEKLVASQQEVAIAFERLEKRLLEMAELSAAVDPERAALLRRIIGQSKDRLVLVQLEQIVRLLQSEQLGDALEGQTAVDRELRALLELMLSEDRAKRLGSEKARIREYLKRLGAILNQQKGVQARTARAGEPKQLAEEQDRLAQRTADLAQDIKANEEDADKPAGTPPSQRRSEAEGPGQTPAKSQGQAKDQSQADRPGKGQPQAKGQPQGEGQAQAKGQPQGQTQGGGQGQSRSGENGQPQSAQANPARRRLETAQQRMREAEQKLREAQRQGATEKQEQAIRELEQAKAELERILRQLREEELERLLVGLEARFTKMLQIQREVLEGTVNLGKVPRADWSRNHDYQAGQLSRREGEIDLEAEKALVLLREEGSAVAFPEAVAQMRQDVRQVIDLLARSKVDELTQEIEKDIIAALEEMLKALKKALKDLEDRRQHPQDMPGVPQDPPLVDMLAELKMIRSLQLWVNNRTQRYSKLIQGEQAENPNLIQALRQLAERQQRIYRITRDLYLGKNR